MSSEIERLLGGYATGTLTEMERGVLFEAALEDQQVFDALQSEEALRDLLADGESRTAVERALQRPVREETGMRWYARPWVWGLGGGLTAACVLAIVLVGPDHRELAVKQAVAPLVARNAEMQPAPVAPLASRPKQPAKQKIAKTPSLASTAPPVMVATERAPKPIREVFAESRAVLPASAGMAMSLRASQSTSGPIAFNVLRGGVVTGPLDVLQAGDAIQLVVHPNVAGALSMSQQNAAGDWTSLDAPIEVGIGQDFTVPRSPVKLTSESTFRLILVPAGDSPRITVITLSPGKAAPPQ